MTKGGFETLDDEERKGRDGAPCIITETSALKERWDMLIVLCILYVAFVVPISICFRVETKGVGLILEVVIEVLFCCDLVMSFNTAHVEDGEWVTDRAAIARRYLRGWFWIDAPASLPVELLVLIFPAMNVEGRVDDAGGTGTLILMRVLRMLRLVRMLRLLKVGLYLTRLEETLEVSLRPLRVVELVAQMLFVAHMLACGWFLTTWVDGVDEDKWIDIYDGGSAAEGPVARQYYFSFWWAITTLFAVNPIPQSTDVERDFMIVVNVFNRLFFA